MWTQLFLCTMKIFKVNPMMNMSLWAIKNYFNNLTHLNPLLRCPWHVTKLSVGVPSICVRSFQLMFPHGRCFEIQRKQWLQCFTNGIEIRSCFGKTWYMNEWSANDPPTCTTHATHTISKACKLLCITLLYKGNAPSFRRTPFSHPCNVIMHMKQ